MQSLQYSQRNVYEASRWQRSGWAIRPNGGGVFQRPLLYVFLLAVSVFVMGCQQKEDKNSSENKSRAEPTEYKLSTAKTSFEIVEAQVQYIGPLFMANDYPNLSYELIVFNNFKSTMTLDKIEIFDTANDKSPIAVFDSSYLTRHFDRPGLDQNSDQHILRPNTFGIANLWLHFNQSAAVPDQVFHRLTFGIETRDGKHSAMPIDIGLIDIPNITSLELGLPFKQGKWFYMANNHRDTRMITEGQPSYAQRYAIDWVLLKDDGMFVKGDKSKNESYTSYGVELLAVADGVVREIKDDITDNDMESEDLAVRMSRETIAGNYVVLDIGNGVHAVYAHLIANKFQVKKGDVVKKGQVLGLLGNSGNSEGPHLHFHLESASDHVLGGEGLPYHLERFVQLMTYEDVEIDYLFNGEGIDLSEIKHVVRANQMPIGNGIVQF